MEVAALKSGLGTEKNLGSVLFCLSGYITVDRLCGEPFPLGVDKEVRAVLGCWEGRGSWSLVMCGVAALGSLGASSIILVELMKDMRKKKL